METLVRGDCRTVLDGLPDEFFDTCITDPPYGLSFMNTKWDDKVPGPKYWKRVRRVLKPGALLLSFGGTRTYFRLACAIEDSGFVIKDCIMWVYGSGMPKALDVSKALDKRAGIWRGRAGRILDSSRGCTTLSGAHYEQTEKGRPITRAAWEWDGYNTALKPAWEPIIVAMKPPCGPFADNALAYGVAGFWVEGGKVKGKRWPSNVIHDGSEEAVRGFPQTKGGKARSYNWQESVNTNPVHTTCNIKSGQHFDDPGGSASRYFYCAKAQKKEKEAGLTGFEAKALARSGGAQAALARGEKTYERPEDAPLDARNWGFNEISYVKNVHPTVKPLALMRHLCRITRPPHGGVVLDPFMGSGSTGIAAYQEGRNFFGIERNRESLKIARARVAYWREQDA